MLGRIVLVPTSSHRSIDIFVNNAGPIRRAPAPDFPQEYWNEIIAVNLSSVFHLTQAAGQDMLKNIGGKIINISSLMPRRLRM